MPTFTHLVSSLRVSSRSRWLYVLVWPWLVPLLSYLLLGRGYVQHWSSFGGATLVVGLAVGAWFWSLDRATTAVVRRWPGLHQTWQRVLVMTGVCCALSALFLGATDMFFAYFQPFGATLTLAELRTKLGVPPETQAGLSRLLGFPVSNNLVTAGIYLGDFTAVLLLVTVYEAFYLLGKWQESKLSYEHQKKIILQSQLDSLKNQINPHFLFNTLNSLSSLIAEAPQQAEIFVDEIAKVYRYLLQTNEEALTTLAVELAFIRSYYHLLKTRYGTGLTLRLEVAEPFLSYQLPPLTLQLLVENAVKHNVIQARRPLHILIATTPAGALCVRNNIQPKTTHIESTRVGLVNISARYQLLTQQSPVVEATAEQFTVTLPLLAPP